jgi:hypothetical protein
VVGRSYFNFGKKSLAVLRVAVLNSSMEQPLTVTTVLEIPFTQAGSPAPKPTTSSPAAFIALALESMAGMSDGVSDVLRDFVIHNFERRRFYIQKGTRQEWNWMAK